MLAISSQARGLVVQLLEREAGSFYILGRILMSIPMKGEVIPASLKKPSRKAPIKMVPNIIDIIVAL